MANAIEPVRQTALRRPAPVKPWRLAVVGCLGIATALAGLVLPWVGPLRPGVGADTIAVQIAASLVLLAAGLVAWVRQPSNPVWQLIVAVFFAGYAWELAFIPLSVFWTASVVLANVSQALFSHLVLAFPSGHLRSRGERALVAFIYVYAIGTQLVQAVLADPDGSCDTYCPRSLLAILPNRDLADAAGTAFGLFVPVIGVVVAALVWRHWRDASGPMRRVLRPVALGFPFFLVSASIGYPADALGIDAVSSMVRSPIWQLSGFIMPVAFLIGVLRLRMTRSAVAGAVLELGALPTLGRLQQVLQVRLGDPGLEVLRWSPTQAAWIDQDGRAVEQPSSRADRALLVIDRDGTPVAAIDHDAALLDDPALADTVAAAARVALDATDLRDELRTHGGQQHGLPTGEVTFVFGDIEGSTPLLESLGPRYADLLAEVRRIAVDVADGHGGRMVDALGDEVFLVFQASSAAVSAAVELSNRMAATRWPEGRTVRLRIGVHTGVPDLTQSGYVGLDVHRAARVMAATHGGQVVVTLPVAVSMEPTVGVSLRPLGRYALRGLSEPVPILQVEAPGLPRDFPPLRAEPAG